MTTRLLSLIAWTTWLGLVATVAFLGLARARRDANKS